MERDEYFCSRSQESSQGQRTPKANLLFMSTTARFSRTVSEKMIHKVKIVTQVGGKDETVTGAGAAQEPLNTSTGARARERERERERESDSHVLLIRYVTADLR